MRYKTVTVDGDVDIDIDQFETDELIDELGHRGYTCTKTDSVPGFCNEDWQYLLEMLDNAAETWYTKRIREKLLTARYG